MESHALITYRERGYIDIKVNICTAFPIQNHQIPLCLGSILPIQHLDYSKVKLHQRVNSVSVNSYRIRIKKHKMSVWKNTWKHIRWLIQVWCMRVCGWVYSCVCMRNDKQIPYLRLIFQSNLTYGIRSIFNFRMIWFDGWRDENGFFVYVLISMQICTVKIFTAKNFTPPKKLSFSNSLSSNMHRD